MKTHELKTWPEFFQAILDGKKRHEIRINDRDFAVGDDLELFEYEPDKPDGEKYTGRSCLARVTYLTPGGNWGLPQNVCVMSIEVIP